MRLFLVLGLSTLAAAGPIPSYSNSTMKAGTAPSIPANITFTFDPVATLNKLKTIYDSLNETEHNAISNLESEFLTMLNDTLENSGLHGRSPDSTPANVTLDPGSIQALTKLKAVCDSHNGTDHNVPLKVKRDSLEGFADICNSFRLPPRSTDSISMPDDDSDPLAALIKTQAVSDSLNVKRMGGGLKEKRGFKADVKEGWDWIKDSFKAPGLGARSTDSASIPDHDSDPLAASTTVQAVPDSLNMKQMEGARKEKRESVKQKIKAAWDSFWAIVKAGPYHN